MPNWTEQELAQHKAKFPERYSKPDILYPKSGSEVLITDLTVNPEQEGSAMDSMRVKSEPKKRVTKKEQEGLLSPEIENLTKAPRKQPESDMQIALFDMVYLHETKYPLLARVFHVPNEGYSGPKGKAKGQKRHREGVRAGIFDIFVDVPMSLNMFTTSLDGALIYCPGLRIELKAPGGKMSDAQTDWLNYYREAGYRAEICFSWEEAWNIICEYLGYEGIKV